MCLARLRAPGTSPLPVTASDLLLPPPEAKQAHGDDHSLSRNTCLTAHNSRARWGGRVLRSQVTGSLRGLWDHATSALSDRKAPASSLPRVLGYGGWPVPLQGETCKAPDKLGERRAQVWVRGSKVGGQGEKLRMQETWSWAGRDGRWWSWPGPRSEQRQEPSRHAGAASKEKHRQLMPTWREAARAEKAERLCFSVLTPVDWHWVLRKIGATVTSVKGMDIYRHGWLALQTL